MTFVGFYMCLKTALYGVLQKISHQVLVRTALIYKIVEMH